LTKGSRGSLLLTDSRQSFLEVPAVEVKDTVGAGDAFTAAMIVAILSGLPLARVHRIANEVAAFVCLHQGATPLLNKEKILEQT
jgi:fructokinase